MASKLSFKVKILSTLLFIFIATIVTSFLSANYYVSSYILESEERNMNALMGLVDAQITENLNGKIRLAESLNLDGNSLSEITQKSGFASIIRVINSKVISDKGPIDDAIQAKKVRDQLTQATGTELSNIFYHNKIPFLSITTPKGLGNGNIFYIDLTEIQKKLSQVSLNGQYIQFSDPLNQHLYSNKIDDDLTPFFHDLNIGNKTWTLTAYLDNERIVNIQIA